MQETLRTLSKYNYVPLGDIQIQKEEDLNDQSLEMDSLALSQTCTETLYQAIRPNLPSYVTALMKILQVASPMDTTQSKTLNILTDVMPEEKPTTVLQFLKLGVDLNRHREIIVKAISGILLLLLKHLKINHVYQFEFLNQQLMLTHFIPLVLTFFDQKFLTSYISDKNKITMIDFPACVIGEQPELTMKELEGGDQLYSWRNLFSCINLLRSLNKLIKWKESRVMIMVALNSAPNLQMALRVKHPMMEVYVLKLLKMQIRYLGPQWRQDNMGIISAIQKKVRPRIHIDSEQEKFLRPSFDLEANIVHLQARISQFHERRYCTS